MKKIRRYIFLILCSFLNTIAVYAEPIVILGDENAKPKNWLDEGGQAKGIMIDLLNEVSARTGIEFEYQLYPWKRAYELSAKGEGAIIGFSKTSEREKHWLYSCPMYHDELVIVTTRAYQFEFTGLSSLEDMRLAIKSGASYGDDFEAARKSGMIHVVETPDRVGQLRMLSAKRVDAVLISPGSIAVETVIAENPWLEDHRSEFAVLSPPYKSDPNYLGMPKSMNRESDLEKISAALKAIEAEGLHQQIVDKNVQLVLESLRHQ